MKTSSNAVASRTTCTLNFCCMADRTSEVPSKDQLQDLQMAGLGKRRHTFDNRDGGHEYVTAELQEVYPKLKAANGSFLLYKSGVGGTNKKLTKIRMGPEGKYMCVFDFSFQHITPIIYQPL